jgi:hypothetical protein
MDGPNLAKNIKILVAWVVVLGGVRRVDAIVAVESI